MTKKMNRLPEKLWANILAEYRVGGKVKDLAEKYNLAQSTISRRVKTARVSQDLVYEYRTRVENELLKKTIGRDLQEIAEEAVDVVRRHRADVAKGVKLATKYLIELEADEEKNTLSNRAKTLNSIAQALAKLMPLERQAFSLDAVANDIDAPDAIVLTEYQVIQTIKKKGSDALVLGDDNAGNMTIDINNT